MINPAERVIRESLRGLSVLLILRNKVYSIQLWGRFRRDVSKTGFYNRMAEMTVMNPALQCFTDALDACESEPCPSKPYWMSLRLSSNQTAIRGERLHLICLSHAVLSPWDGSNITYGRHHAFTEQLSSPRTNNSVAMGLIKRNGTNYGPIPARAIMFWSALAGPRQPVQTSRDWEGCQGGNVTG